MRKKFEKRDLLFLIAIAHLIILMFLRYYGVARGSLGIYGLYFVLRGPLAWIDAYVVLTLYFHRPDFLKDKWKLFLSVLLAIIVVVNALPVGGAFRTTLVDGKRPLVIVYLSDIVRDCIERETVTGEYSKDELQFITHTILLPKSNARKAEITYKALYYGEEGHQNTHLMNAIEYELYLNGRFSDNPEKMTIEYYKHSGIIKSIDGINMNDLASFEARFNERNARLKEERNNRKYNEEHKKELDNYALKSYFQVFLTSTGKPWSEVEADIQSEEANIKERGLDKYCRKYTVKEIETSFFNEGEVAYSGFEDDGYHFYIAKSGSKEEMTVIPEFAPDESAADYAIKLHDEGIDFIVYTDTSKDLEDVKVKEVSEKPGTIIPIELQIYFATE